MARTLAMSTAIVQSISTANDDNPLVINSNDQAICSLCTSVSTATATSSTVATSSSYVPITNSSFSIYYCEICKRSFSVRKNFQEHYREHCAEKPYKCAFPECGLQFALMPNCIIHIQSAHLKQETDVDCKKYIHVDKGMLEQEVLNAELKKYTIPKVIYHNVDGDKSNAAVKTFDVYNDATGDSFIKLTLSEAAILAANHLECQSFVQNSKQAVNAKFCRHYRIKPEGKADQNSNKQLFHFDNKIDEHSNSIPLVHSALSVPPPSLSHLKSEEFPIRMFYNPRVLSEEAAPPPPIIIKLKYKCPFNQCGKTFDHIRYLRKHYITHVDVKPFSCSFKACTRQFGWSCNAKRHIRDTHFKYDVDLDEVKKYIQVNEEAQKRQAEHLKELSSKRKDLEVYETTW